MPSPRRRSKAQRGPLDIDPEAELDARLDRKPAAIIEAIDRVDAEMNEHGSLYRLRLNEAMKFGRFSRTVVIEEEAARHRQTALSFVRTIQDMRARR